MHKTFWKSRARRGRTEKPISFEGRAAWALPDGDATADAESKQLHGTYLIQCTVEKFPGHGTFCF